MRCKVIHRSITKLKIQIQENQDFQPAIHLLVQAVDVGLNICNHTV